MNKRKYEVVIEHDGEGEMVFEFKPENTYALVMGFMADSDTPLLDAWVTSVQVNDGMNLLIGEAVPAAALFGYDGFSIQVPKGGSCFMRMRGPKARYAVCPTGVMFVEEAKLMPVSLLAQHVENCAKMQVVRIEDVLEEKETPS